MRTAIGAERGVDTPVTEPGPWPNDTDYQSRFFRLREFYSDEQLKEIFDCSEKKIETWSDEHMSRRWIYSDLSFLNRLDAAVDVTRAFEGLVGRSEIAGEMFKEREALDGRSLADMIANAHECHLVHGAVARVVNVDTSQT